MRIIFSPGSLRPRLLNTHSSLVGQLTHAWASSANNTEQLCWIKSSMPNYPLGRCENVWHCYRVWCHKIEELKAGLLTRHFRSVLEREGLLLLWTLAFPTFKSCYMHKEEKLKKHNRSPLKPFFETLLYHGQLDSVSWEAAYDTALRITRTWMT